MFGYVRPLECELKVKESNLYRATYCGLCRSMRKRHGYITTWFLQYDCTFLSLLYSSLCQDKTECKPCHCLHRAFERKKSYAVDSRETRFCADVNVLLAYHKCLDDWHDDHSIVKGCAALLLRPKIKNVSGKLKLAVSSGLDSLSGLEKQGCPDCDRVADAFASALRGAALSADFIPLEDCAALEWLFYNLGRWIYLIDAWADREADGKKGSYNPFNLKEYPKEQVEFMLYKSLDESVKALDLLCPIRNEDLIRNILVLGCGRKTATILGGKQDESL